MWMEAQDTIIFFDFGADAICPHRLLEVVQLYSSTASYSYIIIATRDLAQGLTSAYILNEHACEKPCRRQV